MKAERNRMSRIAVVVAGVTLATCLTAAAATGSRVQIELQPPGAEGAGNPVVVSFAGKVYGDGLWLSKAAEQGIALDPDERVLDRVLQANRDGTPDDIASLWTDDERDEVRKLAADREFVTQNLAFYGYLKDTALLAKVEYGPYVVFLVRHNGANFDDFVHIYPMVRSGSALLQTNRLQDDPVLNFLFFVYREKLQARIDAEKREREGGATR